MGQVQTYSKNRPERDENILARDLRASNQHCVLCLSRVRRSRALPATTPCRVACDGTARPAAHAERYAYTLTAFPDAASGSS
jgi:hypothetical protein